MSYFHIVRFKWFKVVKFQEMRFDSHPTKLSSKEASLDLHIVLYRGKPKNWFLFCRVKSRSHARKLIAGRRVLKT